MRAPALALTLACTLTTTLCAQVTPWQTQIVASPDAQTLPEDRGADGLAQTLKKLHTWASVMIIVAHPDDEDGGMLTLESRGLGARTAIMTLTRGEGGQDAMTSSTEDELGLIRTNELLLCDQYSRQRAVLLSRSRLWLLQDDRGGASEMGTGPRAL